MTCILNIETATNVCSVGVSQNNKIIFNQVEYQGPSHSTILGVFVDEAVKCLRANGISLDAVAVSCGPGSYTGLRIGVSHAKGLCYGLDIPLIAIPTLTIMAYAVSQKQIAGDNDLLCPMIDARRMEVYDALFDTKMNLLRDVEADIINEGSFADILKQQRVLFFGNGAHKCMDVLTSPHAVFVDDIYPLATDMAQLSAKAFDDNDFVDIAYFEPFYLKEFVGTLPKNKIISPHP